MIVKIKAKPFVVSVFLTFLNSCGSGSSSDDSTAPAAVSSTILSTDSETSTSIAASNVDEAVTSINAGDSSTNASAASLRQNDMNFLSLPNLESSITRTRVCAANSTDKSAVVTLTYSGTESSTKGKYTVSEAADGSESRTWTSSAGTVICNAKNTYAKINWATPTAAASATAVGVNGLKLVVTTKRKRTNSIVYKGLATTKSKTVNISEDGTRTITWAGTDALTSTKTIKVSNTRTNTTTKFDGTTIDLSAVHATLDSDPLSVTVVRSTTGVPTKHTINSGTMSITKSGTSGYYVTNKFTSVVYDLSTSNTDPCTPTSGTIVTNIYASNSTTDTAKALKTITTTFDTSGITASGSGDDATTNATTTENLKGAWNAKCDFLSAD